MELHLNSMRQLRWIQYVYRHRGEWIITFIAIRANINTKSTGNWEREREKERQREGGRGTEKFRTNQIDCSAVKPLFRNDNSQFTIITSGPPWTTCSRRRFFPSRVRVSQERSFERSRRKDWAKNMQITCGHIDKQIDICNAATKVLVNDAGAHRCTDTLMAAIGSRVKISSQQLGEWRRLDSFSLCVCMCDGSSEREMEDRERDLK